MPPTGDEAIREHQRLVAAGVHARVRARAASRPIARVGGARARRVRTGAVRVSQPHAAALAYRGPRNLRGEPRSGEGRLAAGDFHAVVGRGGTRRRVRAARSRERRARRLAGRQRLVRLRRVLPRLSGAAVWRREAGRALAPHGRPSPVLRRDRIQDDVYGTSLGSLWRDFSREQAAHRCAGGPPPVSGGAPDPSRVPGVTDRGSIATGASSTPGATHTGFRRSTASRRWRRAHGGWPRGMAESRSA